MEVKTIVCNNCEATVYLTNPIASSCGKCGTYYNGFGNELAPPEQWGWETGENVVDIMNYRDSDDFY